MIAAAAAACLFLSTFLFVYAPEQERQSPAYVYLLKDWGGKLALFRKGQTEPLEIYELYTHLLPAADAEMLHAGIPLQNKAEIDRLLEDFGA